MLIINDTDGDILASVYDGNRPLMEGGFAAIFENEMIHPGSGQGVPASPFVADSEGNYAVRWTAVSWPDQANQNQAVVSYDSGSEDPITISFDN
jgi:hypothetical protein